MSVDRRAETLGLVEGAGIGSAECALVGVFIDVRSARQSLLLRLNVETVGPLRSISRLLLQKFVEVGSVVCAAGRLIINVAEGRDSALRYYVASRAA